MILFLLFNQGFCELANEGSNTETLPPVELLMFEVIHEARITTKKKAFYIGQLTSVIAKTDVNETAVAFL